jgi:hypothetical protein
MRPHFLLALPFLLVPAIARLAHAQNLPPVVVIRPLPTAAVVGDTIRLPMSNNTKLTGVMTDLDPRSLSLTDFRGGRHTFPTSQIGLFEVQKVRPVGQRFAIGAGVGAIAGLIGGWAVSLAQGQHRDCYGVAYSSPCRNGDDNSGDAIGAGTLIGALVGGGVGIAVPWHDWRLVRLEFGRR